MSREGCIVNARIIETLLSCFDCHARTARGAEAYANSARGGGDCRSLLRVAVSLCCKLGLDHIGDQVVLVAHELHHFVGGGDEVGRWLGGITPLACHHKAGQPDCDKS